VDALVWIESTLQSSLKNCTRTSNPCRGATLKILPMISVIVDRFDVVVVFIVVVVANGSLDLTARAIVLQAFLFD
jgi:hypothetical protein